MKKIRQYINVTLIILLVCILFLFQLCIIHGNSMEDTYHDKEYHLMYHGFNLEPKHSDIVVIKYNNFNDRHWGLVDGSKKYSLIIKRVIGVPGDTIEIRNNTVYLNNQKLDEPYLKTHDSFDDLEAYTLAQDEYFVMGDNRDESLDSRLIGPIYSEEVYGIIIL